LVAFFTNPPNNRRKALILSEFLGIPKDEKTGMIESYLKLTLREYKALLNISLEPGHILNLRENHVGILTIKSVISRGFVKETREKHALHGPIYELTPLGNTALNANHSRLHRRLSH
jgi:hypothetical protein